MGFYSERVFPRLNEWVTGTLDRQREKLLAGLSGRVLEVGFGSGLSAPLYPAAVHTIVGLEPSSGMRDMARARLGGMLASNIPQRQIEVVDSSAERIPFPDGHFDAAVSILVLCTVSDPARALSELRRVIRPGGRLVFFEHVVHPSRRWLAAAQSALNPIWRVGACGCNLNRDTAALIELAGFRFETVERLDSDKVPKLISHIIRGAAINPV